MADNNFVHLHNHSTYSLLDGFIDLDELIDRCKQLNMPAVAVTDHGNMHGIYRFYKKAIKAGIKPIIGMEAYITKGDMLDKTKENGKLNHQLIWCKNNEGLHNLYKISSIGYTEGFYRKPRVDIATLDKYREGLIVTSSCLAGLAPQEVLGGDLQQAEKYLCQFKELFGDDFYLEIQFNGLPEQAAVNEFMHKMYKKHKIEMVTTSDAHYLVAEDWEPHDIVLAMQTKQKITDENRFSFPSREHYIHTPEEIKRLSSGFPGAYENTIKIADQCNVEIKADGWVFPEIEGYSDEGFRQKCVDALIEKLASRNYKPEEKKEIWQVYKSRLDTELDVIIPQGYGRYFETVADYSRWSKERGILMSPSRGSAGGSLVAYVLHITGIDPIKYDLQFERFLSPARGELPKINYSEFSYSDFIAASQK